MHELRTNVLIQSKGASGMLIDCMLNLDGSTYHAHALRAYLNTKRLMYAIAEDTTCSVVRSERNKARCSEVTVGGVRKAWRYGTPGN